MSQPVTSNPRRAIRVGIPLLVIYIGSIVLANWLITRYGLIAIFPGLVAPAGTVAVGGAIMTRDFLQDALGRRVVVLAIILGAAISALMSSHQIAMASGITFLVAETLEFTVYTPLRKRYGWGTRQWSGVVGIANATGMVFDTFLFLWLAGFPVTASTVGGQLVGKAYVTIGVVLLGVTIRWVLLRSVARTQVVDIPLPEFIDGPAA